MNSITTFLHNVQSIEILKKPFWSDKVLHEQIKLTIRCDDGQNKMESEIFLISSEEMKISINTEDTSQLEIGIV
jgi:hypothetical protein